ncbi:hypothetical protein [Nostoc sp. CALU 1950]|uniref:hypothetical protein n=1 Tax=Nostoc sp. CALU 1950 TaxID=3104321 RepID=UPI003EBB4280
MTTKNLTKADLIELRTNLRNLCNQIFAIRENLVDENKITKQEYERMQEAEEVFNRAIEKINNTIFVQIIIDTESPKADIEFSINKAIKGINDLQDINKKLQFVNATIRLVGTISSTIGTGNIANLAVIFEEIRKLPL